MWAQAKGRLRVQWRHTKPESRHPQFGYWLYEFSFLAFGGAVGMLEPGSDGAALRGTGFAASKRRTTSSNEMDGSGSMSSGLGEDFIDITP